jgi:hypothetical protein
VRHPSIAGRPHTGTPIILLINNLHIRIVHAATGEILRELTLTRNTTNQPTGKPIGGTVTTLRNPKNHHPKNK